jgi:hypothetical protein
MKRSSTAVGVLAALAAVVAGGAVAASGSPARVARPSTVIVSPSAGLRNSQKRFASAIVLGADGIGSVRFGISRNRAVSELRRRFGTPSAQGVNTGCGPRYREVDWGDLLAEFRLGRFSGYRYVTAGYQLPIPAGPRAPGPNGPTTGLTTATGITLDSTLAQVREAYKPLAFVGTDRWKAKNDIVFVDDAERDPEPPNSRIIEIKTSTCGDY